MAHKLTSSLLVVFALPLLVSCGSSSGGPGSDTIPAASPSPQRSPAAPLASTPGPMAAPSQSSAAEASGATASDVTAVANLAPIGSSGVGGQVSFAQHDGRVTVTLRVTGLQPGMHGFHVHEFGDCSAVDGASAGNHFNPEGNPHGPFDMGRLHHAGDLGNIEADAAGVATLGATTDQFTLDGSAKSIAGRAVIIHEKADDLNSQPSGNAGSRLACGVILVQGGNTVPIKHP